jgi:hypothetical protein
MRQKLITFWVFLASRFTAIGTLLFLYALFVLAVAKFWFDDSSNDHHFQATRDLERATRITRDMLVLEQEHEDFHEKIRLDGELRQMLGAYLKRSVYVGERLTPDLVTPWPDLRGVDVVVTDLPPSANWQLFNSGAKVTFGENDKRQQAWVVAVVRKDYDGDHPDRAPTDPAQWLVLLNAVAVDGAPLAKTEKSMIQSVEAPPRRRPAYSGGG